MGPRHGARGGSAVAGARCCWRAGCGSAVQHYGPGRAGPREACSGAPRHAALHAPHAAMGTVQCGATEDAVQRCGGECDRVTGVCRRCYGEHAVQQQCHERVQCSAEQCSGAPRGMRWGCAVQSLEGAVPQWVQAVFGEGLQRSVGGCSLLPWGHAVPSRDTAQHSAGDAVTCYVCGGVAVRCPSGEHSQGSAMQPWRRRSWALQCCAAQSHPQEWVPGAGDTGREYMEGGWGVKEQPCCVRLSADSRGAGGSWAQSCSKSNFPIKYKHAMVLAQLIAPVATAASHLAGKRGRILLSHSLPLPRPVLKWPLSPMVSTLTPHAGTRAPSWGA